MTEVAWALKPLGSLAASDDGAIAIGPFGSSMKSDVYVPEGVPVIRGTNLDGQPGFRGSFVFVDEEVAARFDRCIIQPGDLVFPHRGAIGAVGIASDVLPGRWLLSTSMMKFRADPERLDSLFAFYFFRSPHGKHQLLKNASQVGTPGIAQPLASLRSCEIPVPPIDEQRAIAGVLGALDDKIEQNRRMVQTLEKLARAIFRAWFVDFEPIKAKAAGATSFPSMPQAVFDTLPTTFFDSGIGPVPEGWTTGAVKDLAMLSKAQVKPQEFPAEDFGHFSIPAFDVGMRAVLESGSAIKSSKFLVVAGCVLLSKLNPRIARVWLPPPPCGRRQIASTEFLVFVPKKTEDRHYLYCQFQQNGFRGALAQGASGTSNSHQRVRPQDVLGRHVVMPPPSFRQAFTAIADPMFATIEASRRESVKLAEMRDYLLPKLLSGNIRVGDAEHMAAKVA